MAGRLAVALALWAQPSWLPLGASRSAGTPDIAIVELRADLTVRAGRWRSPATATTSGAVFAEEGNARYVGYDLDAATD